ncbi:MAG: sulfatase-like hydrolase/transferase [Clostridiales bacterium]|jgi:arylsulfatase A-like enzyme|nr:sulfatase-like hydrolase/transferase [Clostridiales bacterium]
MSDNNEESIERIETADGIKIAEAAGQAETEDGTGRGASGLRLESGKKVFPLAVMSIGALLFILQLAIRLNIISIVAAAYCCASSALVFCGVAFRKKLYVHFVIGYAAALAGIVLYFTIFGADSGIGALTAGKAGFATRADSIITGGGNFGTRLLWNALLALPSALLLCGLTLAVKRGGKNARRTRLAATVISAVFTLSAAFYMLNMNLRSKPNVRRLWEGHDDYLASVNKASKDAPNVLYVIMDDLGYADASVYGGIISTPNIDSIADEGLKLENFYSSYSVCSPARFATLTGRYPYRGYADKVMYPTTAATNPFATVRFNNSVVMGANADGMLGDEITTAEALQSAGYKTAAFGKWHLGDYGEYLPTNQGFDYFYGSHAVNDMNPYYYVREKGGEYEIVHGVNELKDQSLVSGWLHDEIDGWIRDVAAGGDEPFFAYYATPWPHTPLFVGEEFRGKTGLGDYADCVVEFDYYLGLLFDTLEELGELDDTIIMFTSDNGPAVQGSAGGLRGGKGMVYEGGQKVPFLMRWDNNPGYFGAGETRIQSAVSVDVFPTLLDLCGVTHGADESPSLPADRVYDGRSMLPVIDGDNVIHTKDNPILYMEAGKIHAVQYSVPVPELGEEAKKYPLIETNGYVTFKYFEDEANDNTVFVSYRRKDWLIMLSDDGGESYNRAGVFPAVAAEMKSVLEKTAESFKTNRRGIV